MSKGAAETFFQRGHANDRWVPEKIHNITGHQGNASQNHNEVITSHLLEWLSPERQEVTRVDKDAEQRKPWCAVTGNMNWCRHHGNQYKGSSKIKSRTAI